MSRLLDRLQVVIAILFLSAGAERLLTLFRKGNSNSKGSFIDMLAISPSKRKPEELVKLLNSDRFDRMELVDRINLLQEMSLALIRPNMGFEETVHVRGAFISTVMNIMGDLPAST